MLQSAIIPTIIPDRFHGTAGESFFARLLFFVGFRLLVNEGIVVCVRTLKILRSGIAANIAIYTS
jgi:TRAP-type mannitol/chloroaromatic compound transport system permease small subunit